MATLKCPGGSKTFSKKRFRYLLSSCYHDYVVVTMFCKYYAETRTEEYLDSFSPNILHDPLVLYRPMIHYILSHPSSCTYRVGSLPIQIRRERVSGEGRQFERTYTITYSSLAPVHKRYRCPGHGCCWTYFFAIFFPDGGGLILFHEIPNGNS